MPKLSKAPVTRLSLLETLYCSSIHDICKYLIKVSEITLVISHSAAEIYCALERACLYL